MKTKAGNQNRFLRIVKAPIRALGKARDFYVTSMIGCANIIGNRSSYLGNTFPNYYSMDLPSWSFTVNASGLHDTDDLRELTRAAAAGSRRAKGMPPRSQSVGLARIDEEKSYAAGEISGKSFKKSQGMFPRSKSCMLCAGRASVF